MWSELLLYLIQVIASGRVFSDVINQFEAQNQGIWMEMYAGVYAGIVTRGGWGPTG